MNPEITKMEHFTIIVNSTWPFAIVAKSFILNAVRFLDTPLHCNKSAPKAVGWFKPERMVVYIYIYNIYIYIYICMHTLEESI